MDSKEALTLLREIRDLLQVILVQHSPSLSNMLSAIPIPSRPSQAWSTCGHLPEPDADIDPSGQV
jgi:hypothetical protein